MGRKCDTTQRCNNVGQRKGSTEEGKRDETTPVGQTRILLGQKMKKIRTVDSGLQMDGEDLK
jgi:hypothetical protein